MNTDIYIWSYSTIITKLWYVCLWCHTISYCISIWWMIIGMSNNISICVLPNMSLITFCMYICIAFSPFVIGKPLSTLHLRQWRIGFNCLSEYDNTPFVHRHYGEPMITNRVVKSCIVLQSRRALKFGMALPQVMWPVWGFEWFNEI